MMTRPCPVCKSINFERIACLNFLMFDDISLHGEGELVTCRACGAVYYVSHNTPEDYRIYYAQNANYLRVNTRGMGTLRASELQRYRNTSLILQRYLSKSIGMVADIGCGQGGCIRTLSCEGWRNIVGVDPLAENVEAIRSTGLRAEQGFVENLPLQDASCKAILLSHVLEHLYAPEQALTEISRVLADSGVLYIEVPDAAAYPTAKSSPFCDCIHEHINHFDKASIVNCLAKSGFFLLEHGVQSLQGGCGGDSCLYAVFEKTKQFHPVIADHTLAGALKVLAQQHINVTIETINKFEREKLNLHLWGVSSYSQHIAWLMLQRNINFYLYDISTTKQQRKLFGHIIRNPQTICERWDERSRIMIPYSAYQQEISDHVKSNFPKDCAVFI